MKAEIRRGLFLALGLALGLAPASPDPAPTGRGARYLIIAEDDYCEPARALAEWKTRKGMPATVVPLSAAGSTPTAVRGFVRNAYLNWPVRPNYLLLLCSPDRLPGYQYENDCFYGDMTGDYRMEISVGRLPARNIFECRTMIEKSLRYERAMDRADSSWLLAGATVVGEDAPDSLYLPDCRHLHRLWLDNGYHRVDSFYNLRGDSTRHVLAALNQGRSFFAYRGTASGYWAYAYWNFRPDSTWRNRTRTPVFVSATCATVTLAPGEEMLGDRSVRFGEPESLGGAVAFFGTTGLDMHVSEFRSACFRGFFDALYREGEYEIGPATLRGRHRVDSLYHNQKKYEEWALLGDPALCLWTGAPRRVTVSHDSAVEVGPQSFRVSASDAEGPVQGAVVCVMMDTLVYAVDTTDAGGTTEIAIAPARPGLMDITVTGRNLVPYEGRCRVLVTGRPFVLYLTHLVNDSPPAGNGDGFVGASETITMPTWVKNYGDSAARGLVGLLGTADSFAFVLDSVRSFGTVPGRDSAFTGPDGFRFAVAPSCPEGHALRLSLECRDSLGATWQSEVRIPVVAAVLEYVGRTVADSGGNANGRLDPRERAQIIVTLRNAGSAPAHDVRAVLRSGDARLVVNDSLGSFGTIPSWAARSNSADRFEVTAGHMLPEAEIPCTLRVTGNGYAGALVFVLKVGVLGRTDPVPDGPRTPALYWAYDDCDTAYAERPAFDWVELRGTGTRLDLSDNQTKTIELPPGFGPFTFYGERYDRISVCSNGWIAPGAVTQASWNNVRLPKQSSPAMLAPNWDDLLPQMGGGVWYYHDAARHRFVVEWDSVYYRIPAYNFDKFEVVLYDSTLAARDGNSEFCFQYMTANWLRGGTVGIQDQTFATGMTALYDTAYHRSAARIIPGRAIKFSTDVPVPGVEEARPDRLRPALAASPNPFRSRTVLSLMPAAGGPVALRIFDSSGRLVRVFRAVGGQPSAVSFLVWDGTDARGRSVPAGVYYVRLVSPDGMPGVKLVRQR